MALTTAQKSSINNLYQGYFGRAGDTAGIDFWDNKLESGQVTLLDIANAFAAQPEATTTYAYLSAPSLQPSDIAAFVTQVYQNLFHRAPDADGLAFWSGKLAAGELPGGFILDVINAAQGADLAALASNAAASTPLTDAQKASVVDLYIGYLGRAPDPASLSDWFGKLQSSQATLADVADSIASQAEAKTALPYLSAPNLQVGIPAFIDSVYQNLFHRGVDAGGLDYWSGVLRSGVTPGQFILKVLALAQGDDLAVLANRQAAALAYAGDVVNLGATWTLDDDRADAAQVLANVTSDPASLTAAEALAVQLVAADVAMGVTYPLTAGIDTLTGTSRNDTFTSTLPGALGQLDIIDGGAGTDTLNVTDTGAIAPGSLVKVTNVETANLVSAQGVTIDTSSWTGLTALNVSGNGTGNTVRAAGTTAVSDTSTAVGTGTTSVQGGSNVTVNVSGVTTGSTNIGDVVAPTGMITVNAASVNRTNADNTAGAITVSGGTQINITQSATNPFPAHTLTMGTVTVNGGASTTAVTVVNTAASAATGSSGAMADNTVAVYDVNGGSDSALAGTITSVSISNYTVFGIQDNALRTLSLTGGSGNIIIDNSSNLASVTNKTLDLTVNGLTGGTLDDADVYTTLNVTATGKNSTLANITNSALTALTVAGDKTLTLTSTAGLSALTTVTVSGVAGLTANLGGVATLTAIDTSASTGPSTVTLTANRASFTGGGGVDKVTAVTGLTKAIALGGGDDSLVIGNLVPTAAISGGAGTDSLSIDATNAATASGSGTFAGLVTGFEQLVLTGATNQTVDLAVLGIADQVTTRGGNGLTLANFNNNSRLVLDGAGTAYTIGNPAFAGGTNDTVNLTLTDKSGAGVAFASTGITTSGVENIAITTVDGQATPSGAFNDSVSLLGNTASSITVSGNAGLTLTARSTRLSSLDASGVALGGFTWTAGALANPATVRGSATGTNTVDLSAANSVVTYTGGSGNDSITNTSSQNDVVSLGNGTNSYQGNGNGNVTVTGGSGADTVSLGSGNNTVSLGDGTNAFTATSGNNTYVGGSGVDTVTLGGGANTVTLGGGNDTISLTASNIDVFLATTLLDPMAGDTIRFADLGTETFSRTALTLGGTAGLQDYANAVIITGGNASANGAFGWFQFAGDTYLVESRHDGTTNQTFLGGTDFMIKLQGTVDLSTASFNNSNSLTLA